MKTASLLQRTFEIMREDYPQEHDKMVGLLGRRRKLASLVLDGESFSLVLSGGRMRVVPEGRRGSAVDVVTSGRLIADLLDGKVKLEDAVEGDCLSVCGTADSLDAFARVIESVLAVAPSSARMVALQRTFRAGLRRRPLREGAG